MKTVILKRRIYNARQTLGELSCNQFTCKTLELPWLNNQPNISCIPEGLYDVRWSFSPKLLRYTYEVLNVPHRSGIRIHRGNFFFNVEGCILLGTDYQDLNHDGEMDVINSTITLELFENFMDHQPFQLKVERLQVNTNKNMIKWIRLYTTESDVVNTYNVENNAVESVGETHAFTSAEDAISKCTSEVFIFWDGKPVGEGSVTP